MLTLNFQTFQSAHLPEMVDLWVESWALAYPDIDFEARRGWAVDTFVALAAKGVGFDLAFDASTAAMVGFLTLDARDGHINQVAVAKAYWGQGVADILLNRAKAMAPGLLKLEVNADNLRAIALYRRHGFVEVGRGANPNSGREIMMLEWRKVSSSNAKK